MTTSADHLHKAARLFATLGHPGRLGILSLLEREGRATVGHIGQALGMDQSALSHQLRVLKDHRLVVAQREGKTVVYQLCDQHVVDIIQDAMEHVCE